MDVRDGRREQDLDGTGDLTVRELLAELVALEDELRDCPEGQRSAALAREKAVLDALHRRPAGP